MFKNEPADKKNRIRSASNVWSWTQGCTYIRTTTIFILTFLYFGFIQNYFLKIFVLNCTRKCFSIMVLFTIKVGVNDILLYKQWTLKSCHNITLQPKLLFLWIKNWSEGLWSIKFQLEHFLFNPYTLERHKWADRW